MLVVGAGMSTLAVDVGRVQLAKSELQAAVDSAARQAAANLHLGHDTAESKAIAAAGYNTVDGTTVVLQKSDIEFGLWDPTNKQFQVLTGSDRDSATAVRITGVRSATRNNAITTVFGRVIGLGAINLQARSTATRGRIAPATIAANACPWLAGMPNGTHVTAYDENTIDAVAPTNSPSVMAGMPVTAGASLFFRQTNGQTSYANAASYDPDGNTGRTVEQRLANGINSTKAPLNALVGIFLDNRAPNTYPPAAELDFSTGNSRDFDTLSPGLKQVFFIGDGMNSHRELQEFIVPAGATRLYLAIMDEKGWWWDNTGAIETSAMDDTVTLVE
jgi:Flp pilus assembly protein TadG